MVLDIILSETDITRHETIVTLMYHAGKTNLRDHRQESNVLWN